MNIKEKIIKSQYILYDQDLTNDINEPLFDPTLLQQHNLITGQAKGRGITYFFTKKGHQLVLRHYRRGGFVAKCFVANGQEDRYFWTGHQQTRAWQEWHLLAKLIDLGLPVPHPFAARVLHQGLFYTADIVTVLIENAEPLGEKITKSPLEKEQWENIGKCIRHFHNNNVYHADLNANNILLADNKIFLADFDKGKIKTNSGQWKDSNLSRLKRSFKKLQSINQHFHFSESDWITLRTAYDNAHT